MAKLQWLAKGKKTLWQAWLKTWVNRGGKIAIALSLVMAIAVTSCGQSPEATYRESASSVGSVKTAPVPTEIAKLARYMESYRPKVAIVSPRADEVLQDTQVSVRFNVHDYPLFKDAELGLGPNLHVILDNKPYIAHYDANQPLLLTDLEPGTHTLRVFAARPWHESFKNREAYAQTTFHVFTKTEEYTPQPQLPVLTYSSPSEGYGAEPILLDVWLANAPIRESLVPDVPKDWRIRYTLNGDQSTLDRWQPIYLTGLKSGRNIVSVELVDGNDQPIRNVFNSAARTIEYRPGGIDTLSKLVRGSLKAEDALAIVGVAPEPEPIPEPEPEPEVVPEPVVEPEAETQPVTEPDQAPESSKLEAADEEIEEAEDSEPVTEPESVIKPEMEESEPDVESKAGETAGDVKDEELAAPSDTIAKPELDIQPESAVDESKPALRDELEESEQVSEPESSEPGELSEPETSPVEPPLSPSDSSEIPASEIPANRNQGPRSWWQKLRGRLEQDATLKPEPEESIPDEIPPVTTDGEEALDSTPPVPEEEASSEASSDSDSDRQSEDFEDSVDSADLAPPADTETAKPEVLETGITDKEPPIDELDTDRAGADEGVSEEESATEAAPAAVKPERPLNFWQKFLRDRQPIPSEEPAVVPEVPTQLTPPELQSAEEELETPAETSISGEELLEEAPVEETPVEIPASDRQPEKPVEPEQDQSASLEAVAEPESPAEAEPQPDRPRSFLQRLQQQRQSLPTNRPSLTPTPESVDESTGATEESETDSGTATQLETSEIEDSERPEEQAIESRPPSTSDRPRFFQRFQQERQQPTTRPNVISEPKSSSPSQDLEPGDEFEAEDTTSPIVEQPTSTEPPDDDRQESPLERPRGFLQKLRQQRRQPPSLPTEIPSTLSDDDTQPRVETPVVEPRDTTPQPDILQPEDAVETTSDVQPETEPNQASAPPTQPDRPRGFLQRFQRRSQQSVKPPTQLPAAPQPPQTEETRPESTPQVVEDKPTTPDTSSDSGRPYPFLEQLKRDRDKSSDAAPPRPKSSQQEPVTTEREQPAPPSAQPFSPSEQGRTIMPATPPAKPQANTPQSRQETSRNFNIPSGSSLEQRHEITTVEKSQTPDTARNRSLLPSSISDQPQRISIPPSL